MCLFGIWLQQNPDRVAGARWMLRGQTHPVAGYRYISGNRRRWTVSNREGKVKWDCFDMQGKGHVYHLDAGRELLKACSKFVPRHTIQPSVHRFVAHGDSWLLVAIRFPRQPPR